MLIINAKPHEDETKPKKTKFFRFKASYLFNSKLKVIVKRLVIIIYELLAPQIANLFNFFSPFKRNELSKEV